MKMLVTAAAAATMLAAAGLAAAQEMVVTGLNNPRGLAFGPNGDLYIAEAGTGGGPGAPCVTGPDGPTSLSCPGETGAVALLHRDGGFERVATGLYSTANPDGTRASGPAGIAVRGAQNIAVAIGFGGATPAYRDTLAANGIGGMPGMLVRLAGSSPVKAIADIAGHEAANDPDMRGPESNPYGAAFDAGRGVFLIADAAANALIEADGEQTRTVAAFPVRPNPLPFGPPFYQSVPTGVAVGPDGAYYVGELTGVPFVPGAARIYRVMPGGALAIWASGFTNIVNVAAGADGLYVVELASAGLLNGPPIGSVVFVPWNDPAAREVVAGGLFAPGAAAIGPEGDLYVTVNSVLPGAGKVLRFPAHASAQ